MASKRNLKKSINYIAGDLFEECLVLQAIKKADQTKVDEVLVDILNLQNEFLSRCNHPEPGNIKGSYKALAKDFADQVEAILKKIEAF